MDVRCERCKTEYEFEDSRITEAGVTVKCTTCGHVFKVQRTAPAGGAPLKLENVASPAPQAATFSSAAAAAASGNITSPAFRAVPEAAPAVPTTVERRDWKVRQANGNVFSFKELTTLQKWIVERKVTRDDEISLGGETWKRLGNIADLASFFQVVDEAQRAVQLSALQAAPSGPAISPAQGTPALVTHFPPTQAPAQVAITLNAAPAAAPAPAPVGEATTLPASKQVVTAAAAAPERKRGAAGWLIALLVVTALGAGGYYGYTEYFLPMQARTEQVARVAEEARAGAEKVAREQREAEAARKAEEARRAEEEARKAEETRRLEEEARLAALAAADAGTAEAAVIPPDAGTTVAAATKQPVRNFDYWMAQGDRLRDQDRGEAALDAYGKAVDLKPDRAEPYAGRGLALLDMGAHVQAEAAFRQALKLNGRYGEAIMGLAETYRLQAKNPQALEYYRRYLEVLPNGPEAAVARTAIARLGSGEVRD